MLTSHLQLSFLPSQILLNNCSPLFYLPQLFPHCSPPYLILSLPRATMSLLQELFTNVIVNLLGELSNSFISNIWNTTNTSTDLHKNLQTTLKAVQETLKRINHNKSRLAYSQIPSDWLDELVWCQYEIEDAIDSINLAVSKQPLTIRMMQSNLKRIETLQLKLEVVETKLSIGDTDLADKLGFDRCGASLQLSPVMESLRVKDKEAIIAELKSHQFGVSILGMGGTGKTKLAEAIVDDVRIKNHFSCLVLPPTSREFNLDALLEDLNGMMFCEKRRVLIQLDGLHSVNPEDWQQLQSQCRERLHIAIKVLITTQNPRVVDVTGSRKYNLGTLSADDCLYLINKRARVNENLIEDDVQAMKHNEKELVEKCNGLPLLANHIGLLLSAEAPGKRDNAIRALTACSMWRQSGLERVLLNLTPVSMLAENPHLQRCVAYCSLFPPDHGFKKDCLVQLWMVEGFTPYLSTTEDADLLEHIASKCFDDLLSHSIFQASEDIELSSGEESSYKMHQLLYDLAQNVASQTFCRIHVGNSDSAPSLYTRHFSLSCENIKNHEEVIYRQLRNIDACLGLRTFLLLHRTGEKITKNLTFFEKFECLRVLDLSHANLTKLSNISKLKHLRYLNLSHTPIKKLPPLSKNLALLILKLDDCDLLQCLPNDLSKLTNLISLRVNTKSLGAMPKHIGKLNKLQTLNTFIVGVNEGYKIAELKNMNDLRESLCITKLENVKTRSHAQEAMLHNKKRLQSLELQWGSTVSDESAKEVLEGLKPPKNLKELTIRKYNGAEFPQWLSTPEVCGMLKNIYLSQCKACTILPSLWKLRMLKTLHLEAMNAVTCLGREFFGEGFRSLESLKICDLPHLTEWTLLASDWMPRLRELQIMDCPRLSKLPAMNHLTSLETLEIHECAKLEELPILSSSVKSLFIVDSDILRQRCQAGNPDWQKIKGINVVIDSDTVNTGEANQQPPPEALAHQSNSTPKVEVVPVVIAMDSMDQLDEPLTNMDVSKDLHQQASIGKVHIEVDAPECSTKQGVSEQHLPTSVMVNIDQEQETTLQITIDHSAKRQRRSKAA